MENGGHCGRIAVVGEHEKWSSSIVGTSGRALVEDTGRALGRFLFCNAREGRSLATNVLGTIFAPELRCVHPNSWAPPQIRIEDFSQVHSKRYFTFFFSPSITSPLKIFPPLSHSPLAASDWPTVHMYEMLELREQLFDD
jgi:hypothetical protein